MFRDERVLRPGDDLPSGIRAGLEASDFLIYLASKEAAESEWVAKELRLWCDELNGSGRLLPVHISDRIKVDVETSRRLGEHERSCLQTTRSPINELVGELRRQSAEVHVS